MKLNRVRHLHSTNCAKQPCVIQTPLNFNSDSFNCSVRALNTLSSGIHVAINDDTYGVVNVKVSQLSLLVKDLHATGVLYSIS